MMALSRTIDARLHRRWQRGDYRARAELAERYLPLARRLALRYRNSGEQVDDLIQVASLGLVKAIDRWDPNRGTTFATFAVPTILGELRRHFRDNTWTVRPPRAMQELSLAVKKARDRLWQEGNATPTVADIATLLGRTQEDVRRALQASAAQQSESLEVPIAGTDEPGFHEVENRLVLEHLFAGLDARAREVLRLRYRDDLLQRDIAKRVGCSQMHVSRVLTEALTKLQLQAAA
jgi:RNA polymerase sigma-B factor